MGCRSDLACRISQPAPFCHPARPSPVIPVLVTGINRGTELALIPVTGTGMTRESGSGGQTRPNNHPPQTASKHSATDPRI